MNCRCEQIAGHPRDAETSPGRAGPSAPARKSTGASRRTHFDITSRRNVRRGRPGAVPKQRLRPRVSRWGGIRIQRPIQVSHLDSSRSPSFALMSTASSGTIPSLIHSRVPVVFDEYAVHTTSPAHLLPVGPVPFSEGGSRCAFVWTIRGRYATHRAPV